MDHTATPAASSEGASAARIAMQMPAGRSWFQHKKASTPDQQLGIHRSLLYESTHQHCVHDVLSVKLCNEIWALVIDYLYHVKAFERLIIVSSTCRALFDIGVRRMLSETLTIDSGKLQQEVSRLSMESSTKPPHEYRAFINCCEWFQILMTFGGSSTLALQRIRDRSFGTALTQQALEICGCTAYSRHSPLCTLIFNLIVPSTQSESSIWGHRSLPPAQ